MTFSTSASVVLRFCITASAKTTAEVGKDEKYGRGYLTREVMGVCGKSFHKTDWLVGPYSEKDFGPIADDRRDHVCNQITWN